MDPVPEGGLLAPRPRHFQKRGVLPAGVEARAPVDQEVADSGLQGLLKERGGPLALLQRPAICARRKSGPATHPTRVASPISIRGWIRSRTPAIRRAFFRSLERAAATPVGLGGGRAFHPRGGGTRDGGLIPFSPSLHGQHVLAPPPRTQSIYLARDGVRLYFNQSGNRWSEARPFSLTT